jgi:hypothetical protein
MVDAAQQRLGDLIRRRNGMKAHRTGSFRGGAVWPKVDGGARPDKRSGMPPNWSTMYLAMRVSLGRWQRIGSGSKADGRRRGGLTVKERTTSSCMPSAPIGGRRFEEVAQARAVLEEVGLAQLDRRWSAQERAMWRGVEQRHVRWEW